MESKPPFNSAGKRTEKSIWIRITNEPYPRLSVVRKVTDDAFHFGPIKSMEQATLVVDALTSVVGVRTCTQKLSLKKTSPSCALGEMGRCSRPCELVISTDDYAVLVDQLRNSFNGDSMVEQSITNRISTLSAQQRFEEAALMRDRLHAWLAASIRHKRLTSLSDIEEIVACKQTENGFDVHIFRFGALAAAGFVETHEQVENLVRNMRLTAQEYLPPIFPLPANSISEAFMINNWLENQDIELLSLTGTWSNCWPNQLSQRDVFDELSNAQIKSGAVAPTRKWQNFVAPK
jgi:DNA polymerase-3 subunit epsilon